MSSMDVLSRLSAYFYEADGCYYGIYRILKL